MAKIGQGGTRFHYINAILPFLLEDYMNTQSCCFCFRRRRMLKRHKSSREQWGKRLHCPCVSSGTMGPILGEHEQIMAHNECVSVYLGHMIPGCKTQGMRKWRFVWANCYVTGITLYNDNFVTDTTSRCTQIGL